jgi:L-amino acid N-acyltransferase YncA
MGLLQTMIKTRTASLADAQEMLEIYRPYVLETPISFETEAPSLEEFQRRVSEKIGKFPWLVCEMENKIVGYAYAGPFRARSAYDWSVESSVYIRRGFHGKGLGKALYEKLLSILKDQGVVNVIGGMTMPNEASLKLHEHFGFTQVAQIKNAGFKMGRWWDVGYWQLQLQKPLVPHPLRPPGEL